MKKEKIISEYMADLGSRQWKKISPAERSKRMKELRAKGKQKKDLDNSNPEAEYAFKVYQKNKNK